MAPMPLMMNAPTAARTTEVCTSPAFEAAEAMPAMTPDAPAVAAAKPASSIGSATTQIVVSMTTATQTTEAPIGTRPSDTPPVSSPEPSETNHVRVVPRAKPANERSADPRAERTNSADSASEPTAARIAVMKAGRK